MHEYERDDTQGSSLGQIAAKTGIPKASLHRYLTELVPLPPPPSAATPGTDT